MIKSPILRSYRKYLSKRTITLPNIDLKKDMDRWNTCNLLTEIAGNSDWTSTSTASISINTWYFYLSRIYLSKLY